MVRQVSAVLLAAGLSRRMGPLKQLLPINDKPAVRLCLDAVISSGISDIVAVVRPGAADVINALDPPGNRGRSFVSPAGHRTIIFGRVKIVCNETPECDMADSVRTGLLSINGNATGVVVCLADHPLRYPVIRRNTMRALLRRFPCSVYYRIYEDVVVVVACMHGRRNPRRWQVRT